MWKFIKWVFGITIVLSVIISIATSINDTQRLNALRETDPNAYLEALKVKGKTKWIFALKELEPDKYDIELGRLIAEARAIPAEETYNNLKAYRTLAKLEPTNEQFGEKVEFYETKLNQEKAINKQCSSNRKSDAFVYAKEIVKLELKAPRTAKFGSYGQTDIQIYKDCVFTVRGHVDAQNGFGAMIRTHYEVRLKGSASGWSVSHIDIQ